MKYGIDNLFRIVAGFLDIIDGLVAILTLGFYQSNLGTKWLFVRIEYLCRQSSKKRSAANAH